MLQSHSHRLSSLCWSRDDPTARDGRPPPAARIPDSAKDGMPRTPIVGRVRWRRRGPCDAVFEFTTRLGAARALWHNAQLSAQFERECAPVTQWIEQLTSDHSDGCAVLSILGGGAKRAELSALFEYRNRPSSSLSFCTRTAKPPSASALRGLSLLGPLIARAEVFGVVELGHGMTRPISGLIRAYPVRFGPLGRE